MTEVERCPGGFRGLFWAQADAQADAGGAGEGGQAAGASGSGGAAGRRTWWYSPLFQRLSLEVPEQPGGGFLCEVCASCARV